MRAVLLFLSFVALVFSAYVPAGVLHQEKNAIPLPQGAIYYTPNADFFNLGNIENPLSVEVLFISGDSTAEANICFVPNQENYPVPGNNLEHACPEGGFVVAQNVTASTTQLSKLKFTRQNSSLRGQLFSKMVEDTNANAVNIYGLPTSGDTAGFVVTTTSESDATFQITLIGAYCDVAGEFPVNGTCVTATEVPTNGDSFTVPAGAWSFYYFDTTKFDPTVVNQVNVNYNVSGNVYIQRGYLPTSTWNLGETTTINTPGTFDDGDVYYIGFDNSASTSNLDVFVNVTFVGCGQGLVGPNCAVNTTSSNSTMDGTMVIELDASLDNTNDGSAISLDLSDSENEYVYFLLVNLPTFPNVTDPYPYYVRVSVGNNNLEDDDDGNSAPALYAKLNGYPSAESNDYAVSGGVANQVFLPVNSADDKWYLAASTPADFSIWVGVNCAGSCDHGSCLCSAVNGTTVDCSTIANSTDYYPLYASLPTSTGESAGACTCDDDDYAESFDCSEKSSPTVLFIVLIIIGGLIILFVAIGVPLYCYISNKRKERYERI